MSTWFNEYEPFPAAWLRNLYPEATVDERSICDLRADDIPSAYRCHFFAGIGGWELALDLAGWPRDREVWTGSCPCQPWSLAGLRRGHNDERDLFPEWLRLIRERRPGAIFGEQVVGAIGAGWLDAVFDALEAEGYSCGAVVLGAHSVEGPHVRQRIYFSAYSERDQQPRQEPRRGQAGRVGRVEQPIPWQEYWEGALSRLRVVGDGLPRNLGATDAARNAIVPQVAATFVRAFMEATC